ncbi:tetratricopeptide repeat protein, partial [Streptomyces alkaliphilus]
HPTRSPERHHAVARVAADALVAVWPDPEPDTALAGVLRANTTALTGLAEEDLHRPDTHPVLFRAGRSLGEAGQVAAAIKYHQRLLDTVTRHPAPGHQPDTLTSRLYLAYWRGQAGDVPGAITAYEELLADQLRVLGRDHSETLTARLYLAALCGQAGDVVGAVTATEKLLADRLRVLGPHHPHTLTTRGNLAHWHGKAGDAEGAATACENLLTDMVRVLGPDHPQTLTTRHNLAHWRGEAGDPAGAVTGFGPPLLNRLGAPARRARAAAVTGGALALVAACWALVLH